MSLLLLFQGAGTVVPPPSTDLPGQGGGMLGRSRRYDQEQRFGERELESRQDEDDVLIALLLDL